MLSVLPDLRGKRNVNLFRASTNKQTVGEDKDIPAQKDIIHAFNDRTGVITVREFTEGGVSGWKVKMNKRDAVQKIKAMAERREFDVLTVYYSDRIGRTSDECPMIVKYLNEQGILVISSNEGIISCASQEDKLMTFLRFWNNENESVKISNRSTDYHIGLIKDGRYRGGGEKTLAYGYRLVDKGTKNAKGRHILDVEIDPDTSEIVRLIYDSSVKNNWGAKTIASYLNEHYKDKAKDFKGWSYRSVQYILHNPIYKGIVQMYSSVKEELIVCDEPQEHLIIIPEEIWNKNQQVIKSRLTTDKKQVHGISSSNTLLSGLVCCGHCGYKMYVFRFYKSYTKTNGEVKKWTKDTYKCPSSNSKGRVECAGQTTYSAKKIDEIVEAETLDFIKQYSQKTLTEQFMEQLKQNIDKLVKLKKQKEDKVIQLQKSITSGKKEILKAIAGESPFKPEEIRESIDMAQEEVNNSFVAISTIEDNIAQSKSALADYNRLDINLETWEEQYRNGDLTKKKSLLGSIIEKVLITKDGVEIQYNLAVELFKENCADRGIEKSPLVRAQVSHT